MSETGAGFAAPSVRDDVDRVAEAWARARPDLDTTPLQVLSRVTRLALHLDRARRASFAAFGLEPWEFDVLAALRRAGERRELSPSALTAATLVTSGTMTNRIDRLVQRELVERHADPTDRRGVLVRLTTSGASRVDDALADLLAREEELLAALTPGQQVTLAHHLRELLVPFEA